MADKFMYIPDDDTQNYPQLNKPTNQNPFKVPKFKANE